MKPKEALKDLWKKGYFENVRTTGEIDKELFSSYGASTQNLTAVLNNCKDFLRRIGKAGWRQRVRYEDNMKARKKSPDYFAMLNIHHRIQQVSEKRFYSGNYADAILAAFKVVNNLVKEKSGKTDLDGKKLMFTVFNKDNPILSLNDNSTTSEKDEQEGFMYLFGGAMQGIRNPKAHEEIIQNNPQITLEYLAFASLLCRMIDKAKKR